MLGRKITKDRSNPKITFEEAYNTLLACYKTEVQARHRSLIYNEDLAIRLKAVTNWILNPDSKPWLYLCGQCGTGKTTMLKAIRLFYTQQPIIDPIDKSVIDIKIAGAKELSAVDNNTPRTYDNTSYLAIDDLGIEPREVLVYGNICTPLIDLMTNRYERQLVTIITSNLVPKKIREEYGSRIADRLNEMTTKIVFGDTSYRSL